jgi:hypothetical protein
MNNQEQEKEEEFFAVLKLVSGEEIFARVQPCEEEDKTILILDTPVIFETVVIRNMGMGAIKVIPWMEMVKDPLFVMNMDKVMTISEIHDEDIIRIYNRYLQDKDRETNQCKINKDMGFLSSISDARVFLEKLYKSS